MQGVNISDKHIEVIVRQMMRWVKVEDVGDTQFLLEQQVDKFRFHEENERAIANGGKPAEDCKKIVGLDFGARPDDQRQIEVTILDVRLEHGAVGGDHADPPVLLP